MQVFKLRKCVCLLLLWVIQRFSNYIGAQKVITKTCHQPVTFLNSQRIRDGVVNNARIATWLMTLQGWDVEARYAQNYKSSLGNGLAACQKLFNGHTVHLSRTERTATTSIDKSQVLQGECVWRDGHSICRWLPLQSQGQFKSWSGCGLAQHDQCPPQQLKLGPQSSQYAEIAVILITLQLASSHNIK